MTDKRALRAKLRAVRDAFVADGVPAIMPPALFLNALRPDMVVASYRAIGGEVDPAPFERVARDAGALVALPVVIDRATPIHFARADGPLVAGPFGLRQPSGDAPAVTPDIIVTPLLGFDAALNRLGQGAGHYDRAFAMWPGALRIGVAWSVQRVAALVPDPWDMPLHAIVTERGVFLPLKDSE